MQDRRVPQPRNALRLAYAAPLRLEADVPCCPPEQTTHAALEAVDACVVFADMLADAIEGRSKIEVLRDRSETYAGTVTAGSWRNKPRSAICSGGYVVHSLEAALWSTAQTSNYRDAVLIAANLGEDADTTAAITGQLEHFPAKWAPLGVAKMRPNKEIEPHSDSIGTEKALPGALYGASAIPADWLNKLSWQDRIRRMAADLMRAGCADLPAE